MKLQEAPESIPTGEIPRTFQICVDRNMVGKLSPGTRCKITGIYRVFEGKSYNLSAQSQNLKTPFIHVLCYELLEET